MIDFRLLTRFAPLQKLDSDMLIQLARQARLRKITAGNQACDTANGSALCFVIKGQVELKNGNGKPIRITAGSERSAWPLFDDEQCHWQISSCTGAYIVELDKQQVQEALDRTRSGTVQAVDYPDKGEDGDHEESMPLRLLRDAYEREMLELPSMPEVALRLREATRDPDVNIEKLVTIIQTDAAIAASLLHAANGPLFCAAGPVKNLRNAVVRLGLSTTQSLSMAVGLSRAFHAHSAAMRNRINHVWRQSLSVSGLSYAIARRVPSLDPDRALLAGLLHQVGSIAILVFLDAQNIPVSAEDISAALNEFSHPVGELLIRHWDMGEDLIEVIREYNYWERSPEHHDYCDVVQVAWLYHINQSLGENKYPSPEEAGSFRRLGLSLRDTQSLNRFSDESESTLVNMGSLAMHG